MSIATVITEGLGGFGNIPTLLTEGLSTYTGLPQPPAAGYNYVTCATTSFTGLSLQQGAVPAVVVGDVFIAQDLTNPSSFDVDVNTDGTLEVFAGGNPSRQSFLYNIYRVASNALDTSATVWVNEIAPVWNSGVNLPTSQFSPIIVGTAITPVILSNPGYAVSNSGDTLVFSLNSGSLPPGITLSSAGVLSGTPTTMGTYSFTINATDLSNTTTASPSSLITVVISVPLLIGLTGGAASSLLIADGFVPIVGTPIISSTSPSGTVGNQNPTAGTIAASGSSVTYNLFVSTGTTTPTVATATYDLAINQGATFARLFTWTAGVAGPVDLTGYTAAMQIKSSPYSPAVLYDASSKISIGAQSGTIALSIPAADTLTFTWWTAVYDLLLTDPNGNVVRLLQGAVNVSPGVTP